MDISVQRWLNLRVQCPCKNLSDNIEKRESMQVMLIRITIAPSKRWTYQFNGGSTQWSSVPVNDADKNNHSCSKRWTYQFNGGSTQGSSVPIEKRESMQVMLIRITIAASKRWTYQFNGGSTQGSSVPSVPRCIPTNLVRRNLPTDNGRRNIRTSFKRSSFCIISVLNFFWDANSARIVAFSERIVAFSERIVVFCSSNAPIRSSLSCSSSRIMGSAYGACEEDAGYEEARRANPTKRPPFLLGTAYKNI
ncbi:hypothetical protein YC2023_115607 [Brassica napus]